MRRNCQEQSGTDAKQSVELTRQGYSKIKNSDMSYIYQPNEGCAFLYFEKKGGIGENEAAHNVNGKKNMFTLKGRERNGLKNIYCQSMIWPLVQFLRFIF